VSAPSIGVDVGGSHVRAAVVSADGELQHRRRLATPRGDGEALVDAVVQACAGYPPELPLGIAVAGLISRDGEVLSSVNVGIAALPLRRRVAAATGRAVVVANDATLAALGEQRRGVGQAVDDLVLITVGTGVGGGIVIGGRPHGGANGFAGEVGHLVVEVGGRRCPCGRDGCLEAYASGTAIATEARRRLRSTATDSSLRGLVEPRAEDVLGAADAGDRLARGVLEDAGRWLGYAAAGVANLLDPHLLVLGGGAGTAAHAWLLPPASQVLAAHLLGVPDRDPPGFVVAALGDDAGVIGAAILASEATTGQEPR
jgi:glucokinase